MELIEILNTRPYSLNKEEKRFILNSTLSNLTRYHYQNCQEYRKMLDSLGFKTEMDYEYTDLPFLPVRLFKMMDLLSVGRNEIVKTMMSSGTTNQIVSKIYLDKETASNQTRVLTKIVSSFIGNQRVPMIIIDSPEIVSNRNLFSARGAGILGFSIFGNKRIFALNEKMELDVDLIQDFIERNRNEKILLFGFTYIIWQHFYKELVKKGKILNLENSILIHGGGWKKLAAEKVLSSEFKSRLEQVCSIKNVHDYYGMVEQTGNIYMECEKGYLHVPVFSDVIIRRPFDFSVADFGEKGIIQVLSILPHSYPGHSLITEDEGILIGEDDCRCGRLGKYFNIIGRLKNAEIRGCSDVYTAAT